MVKKSDNMIFRGEEDNMRHEAEQHILQAAWAPLAV
jgi:hypothetical protein